MSPQGPTRRLLSSKARSFVWVIEEVRGGQVLYWSAPSLSRQEALETVRYWASLGLHVRARAVPREETENGKDYA